MKSKATASWQGGLKAGNGAISADTGAFAGLPFNFGKRFEGAAGPGTTPEELIAAAHAGCFSMALSAALAHAGHKPVSVDTTAVVHLEQVGPAASVIAGIDLVTRGVVPGLDPAEFLRFAEDTKQNCIISKALAAVPMTLRAELVSA